MRLRASLRERSAEALAATSKRSPGLGPWAEKALKALRQAPAVDGSEAFSYFWDETADEETFSLADFPCVLPPEEAIGDERGAALFVEGEIPRRGLPMSMIVEDGSVGKVPAAHMATCAAAEGKPALTLLEGEPGLAVLEDAMISRAGALLVWDRSPARCRSLYASFGREAPAEVWGTLALVPFYEHTRRLAGRMGPQQLTIHLPISADGRPLVIPHGEEPLPINILGRRCLPSEIADGLASGQRPLLLMTLFAVACLGSPLAETVPADPPRDALGRRRRLILEGLADVLDDKGGARELGVGHALAACGAWFGGD